jgi:alkanesulfonate monooxygenase SsuD/methylene tetrahydromethanopterin reductase-like flavin-dependent oxidoreductase (luciferase family)
VAGLPELGYTDVVGEAEGIDGCTPTASRSPTGSPPKDVPAVRAATGPDRELVARIFVCPTTDARTARYIGRRMIAAYLTMPVYAAFHQWLGRGDIIEPMLTAWNSGDRKGAVEAIPDALVDDLVIHGPAERCRDRVAEYQAAGPDTAVIAITPVPGLDLADTIRKLAPA